MATHDYVIDNQSASAFRSDLNGALQAIVTQNSSGTAPTTTYANMIWYDTANNQLKKRNEAGSAWITLGTVDEVAGTFTPNSPASIISKEYTSTDQTITSSALLTLAHSLGATPKIVQFELVCQSTDNGWASGDVIIAHMINGATRTNSAKVDATNVSIRFSDSATCFSSNNKSTGVTVNLTNANWKLRVRAFA